MAFLKRKLCSFWNSESPWQLVNWDNRCSFLGKGVNFSLFNMGFFTLARRCQRYVGTEFVGLGIHEIMCIVLMEFMDTSWSRLPVVVPFSSGKKISLVPKPSTCGLKIWRNPRLRFSKSGTLFQSQPEQCRVSKCTSCDGHTTQFASMDNAEFHAAVCYDIAITASGNHFTHISETVRYMTLYDAFPPAASQAMVRFLLSSQCSMLLIVLPGHIAKLIGMPNYSRHVGQGEASPHFSVWLCIKTTWAALKFLPPNTNPPIPWHRVIGASGTISSRGPGTTGAQRQHDALQAEGVEVTTGRNGEMRVNLREFGWFPSITELNLPHHQDDDDDDGSETQTW